MVKLSREYTKNKIFLMQFDEIDFENEFDGVWASASLLHVSSDQFLGIMEKTKKSLKSKGTWYLSLRFKSFEGFVDNHYYHYMTEEKMSNYIHQLGGFQILEMERSKSYEADNNLLWLHCLLQKE